jgi:hypothetical protein
MPRLSDPRITKGHAVSFLLRLYLEEPGFAAELLGLRQIHRELFEEFVLGLLGLFARYEATMTTAESRKPLRKLYEVTGTPSRILTPPTNLANLVEEIKQLNLKLKPYFRDLEQLAFKWKFRAPWAGPMLHLHNMHDYLTQFGVPDAFDAPLDQLDLLYPWPPLIRPLEIRVSSWASVLYGRTYIQAEIAKQLKDYEDQLKALKYKEYPSSLQRHAKWWFEHYVKGKIYRVIHQQFPRVEEETIKRKVYEFSKLTGVKTR